MSTASDASLGSPPVPSGEIRTPPLWRGLLLVLPGLLAAFALRIYHLTAESIWYDEAASIIISRHSWGEIASQPGIHPPLYFYLLHAWMGIFGDSEFAVRILSVFTSFLLVAAIYRLTASLFSSPAGLWAMGLSLLSPFLIYEAQETRMYSLLMLLATLSVYALWRAATWGRREDWILLGVFLTLGLYTHYSFLFLLLAANAWVLVVAILHYFADAGKIWKRWIAVQTLALGLFTLYLPFLILQLQRERPPAAEPANLYLFNLETWVGLLAGPSLPGDWSIYLSILILSFLVLVLALLRWRRNPVLGSWRDIGLIAFWALIPLAAFWLAVNSQSIWHPTSRYVALVAPALLILLGWLVAVLNREHLRLGLLAGTGLLAALSLASGAYLLAESPLRDDARGVAKYLSSRATEEDLILARDKSYPFQYYPPGPATLAEIKVHPQSAAEELQALLHGKQRVFLIRWFKSAADPWGMVPFLLEKQGVRTKGREFSGYEVITYRVRENLSAEFGLAIPATGIEFGEAMLLESGSGWVRGGTSNPPLPPLITAPPGNSLGLLLEWRQGKANQVDYAASLRLRDGAGRVASGQDILIRNNDGLPTSKWPEGEQGWSAHLLIIPVQAHPGSYHLELVVYDSATQEPVGEEIIILEVMVLAEPSSISE